MLLNRRMKKHIVIIGLLLALARTEAAQIFTTTTTIDDGTSFNLGVRYNGGDRITPIYVRQDSVLERSDTRYFDLGEPFGFWDYITSGLIDQFRIATDFNHNQFVFPDIPNAAGINYLTVDFDGNQVTVSGYDVLDGIPDVGVIWAPDGGATAGLLALGCIGLAGVHRKNSRK